MKNVRLCILIGLLLGLITFKVNSQNFRISGSNTHSVALCSDGSVFAWGLNNGGQLGLDPTSNGGFPPFNPYPNAQYNDPVVVGGLGEIFQIDAGSGSHTLALTCEGRVFAWGSNGDGQLGNPTDAPGTSSASPVNVLRGQAPDVNGDGLLGQVSYVSGGNDESFAILVDRRLVAWGQNDQGQLGDGTTIDRVTPVFVTSGITAHGQTAGQPLENVLQVEAGDENGYALTDDGRVWSWGNTQDAALGRNVADNVRARPVEINGGATLTNIVSITAGDRHALLIDDQGMVWSIGGDWGPGQSGLGPGFDQNPYAEQVIGGASGETFLGDTDPIVEVAAGQAHSMAVSASGNLYTWGANGFFNGCPTSNSEPAGQLGTGNINTTIGCVNTGAANMGEEAPQQAMYGPGNPVDDATGVSDGDAWTFVINSSNEVYVAGWNQGGQLGVNSPADYSAYFIEIDLASKGCGLVIPCPSIDLGLDFEVCPGFTHDINAGLIYPGFRVEYYLDNVLQSGSTYNLLYNTSGIPVTVPTVTVNQVGTWRVVISDQRTGTQTTCTPCPDAIDEIILSYPTADFADPGNLEFCGANTTVNVTESGTATTSTNTYEWYTTLSNGIQLGTTTDEGNSTIPLSGVAFTGTSPNRTATVYVEDVSTFSAALATDPEITQSNEQNWNLNNNQSRLYFSLGVGAELNSVDITFTVNNTNPATVTIRDAGGVVVGTATTGAFAGGGNQVTTVNFTGVNLAAGTYSIENDKGIPVYLNPGNAYTTIFSSGTTDVLTFVSGGQNNDQNQFVPYFNWNLTVGSPYACGRLPVTITENCPGCNQPTSVTAASNATICVGDNANFTGAYVDGGLTPTGIMSYVWYKSGTTPVAGDYSTVVTTGSVPNFPVNAAGTTDAGTYILRVQDGTDPSETQCYNEGSVTLTVNEVPDLSVVNPADVCSPGTVDITGTWTDANTTGGTATYHSASSATAGNQITDQTAINTSGTYYVKVDNNNCTDVAAINVTINPLPGAPTTSPVDYCQNATASALTATIAGGNTALWYTVPTNGTSSTTAPTPSTATQGTTTYYVSQRTVAGCEGPRTPLVVTINANPTATLETGGAFCSEDLSGESLTITVSGGSPDYDVDYTFDNGPNGTINIASGTIGTIGTGLGEGTYEITRIEDVNGCIGNITGETATITAHPDLTVTPAASCTYSSETANISATVSGGVPAGYTVTLESPSAGTLTGANYTNDFSSTANTAYSYTISDGTGCANNSVTISNSIDCGCEVTGVLALAGASSTTLCPGEDATLEVTPSGSIDGGAATYTVFITSDGTTPIAADNVTAGGVHQFIVNTAGTYTILSVDDGNCTGAGTGSETITVLTNPVFTTDLSLVDPDLCPGDALNLNVVATGSPVSGQSALTYVWTKDAVGIGTNTNSYSVASVTDDATHGGVYAVEVTGACGTINSATVDVTVYDDVVITTDLSTVPVDLCPGAPLNLNIVATGTGVQPGGNLQYVWTAPNGVTSSTNSLSIASVVEANEGNYSVAVTGECGTENSAIAVVNVNEEPSATLETGGTFCSEDIGTGSEVLTVTAIDGIAPYTVTYNTPTLTGQTLIINPGPTGDITNLEAGTYEVTQIQDVNGCIGTITGETADIEVHPDLTVTPAASCTFATQTANVSAVVSGGVPAGYTVTLETPGAGTLLTGNYTNDFSSTTLTNYGYTISDGTGCTNNSVTVTNSIDCGCNVLGNLTLSGTDTELCPGETATLEVAASGSINEPSANYTIILVNSTSGNTLTSTSTSSPYLFTATEGGVYTIQSITDGVCTGQGNGSVTLTELTDPVFTTDLSLVDPDLCPGEALNLQVAATGSPVAGQTALTYAWTKDAGAIGTNSSSYTVVSVTDDATDGGVYAVTVTGECGAINSATVDVTVYEDVAITTDLSTVPVDLCPGAPLNLNIVATGTGVQPGGNLQYVWTAPNGVTSSTNSLSIAGVVEANEGNYSVAVTGECGTENSAITAVTVNEVPSALLETGGTFCSEDIGATGSEVLTITAVDGVAPYTVTYNTPSLTGQTLIINPGPTGDISSLETGTYEVTQIEDVNGCIGTITGETATIDVHPDLVVNPLATCDYSTETANINTAVSGGVPAGYTVTSETPNSGTLTGGNYTNSFSSVNNTPFTYTISDGTGCANNSVAVNSSINCGCIVTGTLALATGSNTELCPGDDAILEVTPSGSVDGVAAVYTVLITSDGTTPIAVTNITPGGVHQFTVSTAGTYSILSIDDGNCIGAGTGSETITILENPVFTLDLTGNPVNLCLGEALNLDVTATGSPEAGQTALTYAWTKDAVSVGTNSSSFAITNVTDDATDGGVYAVDVTGACGTINSATVDVTIYENVAITTDLNTTQIDLCPGEPLDLNIVATGTGVQPVGNLQYVWTAPNGVTSTTNSLSIVGVVNDATNGNSSGNYSVEVTGECNAVTSLVTPVDVGVTTGITMQPSLTDTELCPGENFTLNVTADGDNLTYQWQKDGVALLTETGTSLTVNGVSATDAGAYGVVVSGRCGNETSSVVNITIGNTTAITVDPIDAQACAMSNASFGVTATGDNLTYQWFKDGVLLTTATNITDVTSSTLQIDPTAVSDEGDYTVQVSGTCGVETSAIAVLSITSTETPTVNINVNNAVICEGDDVTFTAVGGATGTMPTYEFRDLNSPATIYQAASGNPVYNATNITADREVEVVMTSNSVCITPGAQNPVTANTAVSVIAPAVADIINPVPTNPIDTQLVATDFLNDIEAMNLGGGYNVTWSKEFGAQQGTIESPNSNLTNLTGLVTVEPDPATGVGTTNIILTAVDNGNICPESTDTIVVVRKDITSPPSQNHVFCEDELAQDIFGATPIPVIETAGFIDVDGLINPAGTFFTGTQFTIPVGSTPGTYNVTNRITNSVASVDMDGNINIIIHALPTAADAGDDVVTCTEEIQLNADVVTVGSGLWTCDAGTLSDPTSPTSRLSGLVTGNTVTCTWETNNETCPSSDDVMTVRREGDVTTPTIFVDGANVTGENLDICIDDVQSLSGATLNNPAIESAVWGVTGTSIGGTVDGSTTANQGNMTLVNAGLSQLSYTISSTVPGCAPAVGTVNITVHELPVANILSVSSNDVCEGVDVDVETETIGLTDVASWISTVVPTVGPDTWLVPSNLLTVGSNTITYQVDNPGCDPVDVSEIIDVEEIKNISVSLNPFGIQCEGAAVNYLATPTNGGTAPSYEWSYTEDLSIGGTTFSNLLGLTNLPVSNGTVTVRMTSSFTCTDLPFAETSTNLDVIPGPMPVILTGNTTICVTDPTDLLAQDLGTGTAATSYQWYLNGTIPVGTPDTLLLTDVSTSGSYTVVADNGVCQEVPSNEVTIDVRQVPDVNAYSNDINPIKDDFDAFIELSGSHTGLISTWSVDPSETEISVDDPSDLNSSVTATDGGQFIVTLTSEDGPCIASDSVVLLLTAPIKAPNVFTPNGDGENDTFTISGVGTHPGAVVRIFNRWGGKVYETSNYEAHEWDGEGVPDGVYYFVVELGPDQEKGEGHSGCIHVLR